jgi:uncharacterized membrane protein
MDKPLDRFDQAPALPQVNHVGALRPLLWIRLGWEDVKSNPGPSLAHGLLLVGFGWLVLALCSTHVDLISAAVSGFLLVGPVAGAAFYELSRLRAAGQAVTFDASLDGAIKNGRSLLRLGLMLAILSIAWAWLSVLLFERTFGGALPSVSESAWRTVFDWSYAGFFVTYVTTGAILALIAFVLSAVSAPLLFDRALDTKTAVLTGIKAVYVNPAAMAVWAASIAVLTAIGFATFLVGLVIVLPVLGHAAWHAYRDLIA